MTQAKPPSGELFESAGVGRSLKTYVPATMVYRGISLARGLVLAWLLARQAGQYAMLMVSVQVINILAPMVSIGLNEAITRYVPKYESDHQLIGFLKYSTRMVLAVTAGAAIVLLALAGPLGKYLFAVRGVPAGQTHSLMSAVVAAVAGIVFYFLVIAVLKGLRMFPALALMELVHGVLFLALSILAVVMISPQVANIIWAYLAAMCVPAILWGAGLIKKLSARTDQDRGVESSGLSGKLLWFGAWTAFGGITWQAWQIYSLWHLRKFGSALDSDAFAGARLIGQVVLIVAAALIGVVTTSIYRTWESSSRSRANLLLNLYTKLALAALLVLSCAIVVAKDLIVSALPGEFAAAARILPQVVLFFQLSAALGFVAINFSLIEKTRLALWCWLSALVSNVILCVFWIVGAGALSGAANAAAVACVPALCVSLVLMRAEGQPISRGLVLLLAASPLILLPVTVAVPAIIAITILACVTRLVFDDWERRLIAEYIRHLSIAQRLITKK